MNQNRSLRFVSCVVKQLMPAMPLIALPGGGCPTRMPAPPRHRLLCGQTHHLTSDSLGH